MTASPKLDRSVGVALALGTLLLVAVPPYNLETHRVLAYAIPAAAVAVGVVAFLRRGLRGVRLGLLVPFLGMLAIATSGHDDAGAWRHFAVFAAVALMFTALGSVAREHDRAIWVRSVILLGIGESLYALYEFKRQAEPLFAYPSISPGGEGERLSSQLFPSMFRAQGTFGHPLPLSLFLLVAFALVVSRRTRMRLGGRLTASLVLVGGMVVSGSRSTLLVALLVLMFSRARRSNRWFVGGYALAWLATLLGMAGFFSSSFVQGFFDSGSYTHRANAWDSLGALWNRSLLDVWIGNGYWSTQRLTDLQVINPGGFHAIDNQWVTLFAFSGLVGTVLFLGWLVSAVVRGRGYRIPLLAAVAMFFSFDLLSWPSSLALVAVLVGLSNTSLRHPTGIPGTALLDPQGRASAPSGVGVQGARVGGDYTLR